MTLRSLMNLYVLVAGRQNTCCRTPISFSQRDVVSTEQPTTRKCRKRFAINYIRQRSERTEFIFLIRKIDGEENARTIAFYCCVAFCVGWVGFLSCGIVYFMKKQKMQRKFHEIAFVCRKEMQLTHKANMYYCLLLHIVVSFECRGQKLVFTK